MFYFFQRRTVFLERSQFFHRAAQTEQSRRRYAANGFAFVPQDRAVPHPPHGIGQGRRTGGEGSQAPARRGKHNARALVCSGEKVGIWRRPSQQSRRWNAKGQTPFTLPLLVDPLTLELSPRFRRRSSSVASPVGSMRCIPQSRVECVHYRSVAFPAAAQTHQ
jgi:hypothetical protein